MTVSMEETPSANSLLEMDPLKSRGPHERAFREAFAIFLRLNLRLLTRGLTSLIFTMLAVGLTVLFSLTAVIPSSGGNAILEPNTTSIGDPGRGCCVGDEVPEGRSVLVVSRPGSRT
jgi:hypothetical protein